MSRKMTRVGAAGIAILVFVLGATTAMAAATQLKAHGSTWVKIARENSAITTFKSTAFTDIPGASLAVTVPSTNNGSILIARFQGAITVSQTSGCIVRIVANGTTMEPSNDYNVVGQQSITETFTGSGAIERSLAVTGGSYTVKAQLRLAQSFGTNSLCNLDQWHFIVERMNV